MSILTFLLSLFGLMVVPQQEAALSKPVADPVVQEQQDPNPFFTSPRYCPLAEPDCFEMVERIASGNIKVQPVLVTMGEHEQEMGEAWDSFQQSLGQEFSQSLLPAKTIQVFASDMLPGEGLPDSISAKAVAARLGTLDERTIPVVYWDFPAGGHLRYDAKHRLYFRTTYNALAVVGEEPQGRRREEAFLAWLISIHL